MTDLAPPPAADQSPAPPGGPLSTPPSPGTPRRGGRPAGRRGIAVVMAASLALSAATRGLADHVRNRALPRRGETATSNTSLSSMNSFALGLLLGGLRGPLVMILWTDSENQKSEKNLEGVDTEIEWIRLLQPEFDTVHLFQIWNKAYNISVQMASKANKYDTILSALDYAHNVDAQKPDDINIVASMGQLFFDKFGTSSEKVYYRRRVRQESKPHAVESAARRSDVGWRRVSLDPALDATFHLLPPSPAADLRVLAEPQYADLAPYADGLSPFAYAFNYYKRSEVLLNDGHQHHDQLSDQVIDSRPALSLKNWADEELEQARMREAQAFGRAPDKDDDAAAFMAAAVNPEAVTADLRPEAAVVDPDAVAKAISGYDRVARLAPESLAEYRRHIGLYPDLEPQYRLYMAELVAEGHMATADRDFLRAMATPAGPARGALLSSVVADYVAGVGGNDRVLLRFYTDRGDLPRALPPGFSPLPTAGQQSIEALSDAQAVAAEAVIDRLYAGPRNEDPSGDRNEYYRRIRRAVARLRTLSGAPPATAP